MCASAPATSKPSRASSVRRQSALACSFSTRRGCSRSSSSAAIAAATAGGGERGRGRERARVGGEVAGERAVAAPRSRRRRRARCRGVPTTTSTSPLAARRRRPRRGRPGRPRRARAPRSTISAHVEAVRERDDLLERRDVAVEREHALGDDQRRAAVGVAQAPRRADRRRRGRRATVSAPASRQPSATEAWLSASANTISPRSRERRDDPEVGEVAGAEQQRRLRAEEVGEPLLEPAVQRHRPRRRARRAGAGAPAHGGVGRRLAHARVVGEPEVVARAEQQDGPPVEHHPGALRPAHHPHPAIQPELLELSQAVLYVEHGGTVRPPPDGLAC